MNLIKKAKQKYFAVMALMMLAMTDAIAGPPTVGEIAESGSGMWASIMKLVIGGGATTGVIMVVYGFWELMKGKDRGGDGGKAAKLLIIGAVIGIPTIWIGIVQGTFGIDSSGESATDTMKSFDGF